MHLCQQCTQKNPFVDDNVEDLSNQDSENDDNWSDLTENELKNAINIFNPKKASGPDEINFSIVQKSFQSLKSDYSQQKSYRIITLLNSLGKIAEKIGPNRLAYLGENSNLLDIKQMGRRKNHSAIDAVMNVVHNIKIANRNKNVLSCL